MALDPLLWLCDENDNRIQDGTPQTIRVKIDPQYSYSSEVIYHVWNNIRGTQERKDMVNCYATVYDMKETSAGQEISGVDEDIILNNWIEICCPTYENKWYSCVGGFAKCPIGTLSGKPNSGNWNTDVANRAYIKVRIKGEHKPDLVKPGTRLVKISVGGSY